eukprot:13155080-Ditylum_brightwellii.AAC.1
MELKDSNISPRATPYHFGFPIDAIPPDKNASKARIRLYQSWCRSLNWLAISTRPDLSTAVSFLASFNHCSSTQHIAAACYVGRYLLLAIEQGISFSSNQHDTLSSFVHIPFKEDFLTALSNANWGPQDQSVPSTLIEVPMDKL